MIVSTYPRNPLHFMQIHRIAFATIGSPEFLRTGSKGQNHAALISECMFKADQVRTTAQNAQGNRAATKEKIMKKDRRWLKSILATSDEAAQVTMPWQRSAKRPASPAKEVAPQKPRGIAAR